MPDWFNERHERRGRELSRNDLGHAVIEHLGGQGQADEQPKPLVQRDVLARRRSKSDQTRAAIAETTSSQNICTQ